MSAAQPPQYQQQPVGAVGGNPAVAYNPVLAPGPVTVVQQVVQLSPEQFLTDYRVFALVIAILFGILGPISLATGIPAVLLAWQGHEYMKKGQYETSRTKSLISAYLSFGTMFISIITTSILVVFLLSFRYELEGGDDNNYYL